MAETQISADALEVVQEPKDETSSEATTAATTPEKEPPASEQSRASVARSKLAYLFEKTPPAAVVSQELPRPEVTEPAKDSDDEVLALRAENDYLRSQLHQLEKAPRPLGIRAQQCAGCREARPDYSRVFVKNRCLYCKQCWDRWERCGRWPPSMRLYTSPPRIGLSGLPEFEAEDAFFLPAFIAAHDDFSLLEQLREDGESLPAGKDFSDWHGARHLGMHFDASDTSGLRKDSAPLLVREMMAKLETAFGIEASAARLNLYRSNADYKPFHFDRGRDGEGTPQVTVGISLGVPRELSFAHYQTGLVTSFPMKNGDVFAFTPELNEVYVHGVPKPEPGSAAQEDGPRMSFVLWGSRIVVKEAHRRAKARQAEDEEA